MVKEKIEKFKRDIRDKKITVIGMGVSNLPLIELLAKNGAHVTACDKRNKNELAAELDRLSCYDISYSLGENYLDGIDAQVIFKTPGLRYDVEPLVRARENGAVVTSEMEVFFELCDAKIIAVTGSDGKTTTTTLIAEMLKKQGYKVWVGGNIGNPLLGKIEQIEPDDMVVLELSSFQLHTMRKSPSVAVVTNLSPNHLDMHKDMNEYIDAKKNIFKHQKQGDRLVLNFDNEITRGFEGESVNEPIFFSRMNETGKGVYLRNGVIYYNDEAVLKTDEIKIPGVHNVENYMAAMGALWGLVSKDTIAKLAREFGGVEHRIELVREKDGVRYYNDSIASSPTRTAAGLRSFDQKVILIAGGYDKKIPFDGLGKDIKEHVKLLILLGKTAPKIKKAAEDADMHEIIMCADMAEAVYAAAKNAESGDVVMLSPACASFDMFKNFAVRGECFKKLVNEL